jgi:hypothetical protein
MTQMNADKNRKVKQGQKYPDKNAYGLAENGPGFVEALKISVSICVICGQFNRGVG